MRIVIEEDAPGELVAMTTTMAEKAIRAAIRTGEDHAGVPSVFPALNEIRQATMDAYNDQMARMVADIQRILERRV